MEQQAVALSPEGSAASLRARNGHILRVLFLQLFYRVPFLLDPGLLSLSVLHKGLHGVLHGVFHRVLHGVFHRRVV